jgi:hypothetical protein
MNSPILTQKNENKGKTVTSVKKPKSTVSAEPAQAASVKHIMQLQQTIGNQAVQRLIKSGTIQLEDNTVQGQDTLNNEVDLLAQRMEQGIMQRQPEEEEEEPVEMKSAVQRQPEEEEELPAAAKFEKPLQRKPTNTGIPEEVQAKMENAFNTSFSDVKVHADSSKAPEVGALAYTQGSDIHFAPGQYQPDTGKGQQLLGHELTHVVQQREGQVQPTTEVAGLPVNDDPSLERKADEMARKVGK